MSLFDKEKAELIRRIEELEKDNAELMKTLELLTEAGEYVIKAHERLRRNINIARNQVEIRYWRPDRV